MEKINVELQANIKVAFSDPEKARAFFTKGEWRATFFKLDDLKDVAKIIGLNFVNQGDRYTPEKKFFKDIEGFFEFVKQKDGTYISEGNGEYSYGKIIVEDDEIDCTDTFEE